MHHPATFGAALTAVLAALPAAQAGGIYTKNSPVLQVDARSYGKLIAKSNHTSIVEFYAPWCGHCQNLKPAYEKAAKNLDGLAKVAAVDCDDDANKQFCGSMGVQGFPTLKIVRPSKKPGGKPVVEDYQGARTAKAIVEAVVDKINNHVTRVSDKDLDSFLKGDKPKVLLFTEKGTTSALLRSVAIDYLDSVAVGQIRNKEKAAVEKYGIDKFPTLVLFPGKGQSSEDPIVYKGELNKKSLVEFLSQVTQPNPDPAPADAKVKADKGKKSDAKKASSTKASDKKGDDSKATDKKATAEPEQSPESSASETVESPTPTPDVVPIATVTSRDMLVEKCLQPKSQTCVLALLPSEASEKGDQAVASLSALNSKYLHGKRHLFPFFSVPSDIEGTSALRDALKLGPGVELIVINARRGWWRRHEGDLGVEGVESWIDAIRMGEGKKSDLPEGIVVAKAESTPEKSSTQATEEATEEATQATDPTAEAETATPKSEERVVHEEL
ncbi:hypothetical protein CDD83_1752 [Cordyceps sp. RAO-2017]|nr:hypothetical protein CDD83_1752 [Cordyceps sp. RAO-2017]